MKEQTALEQFLLSEDALQVEGIWVSIQDENIYAPGSEEGAIASGYPMTCLDSNQSLWFNCSAYLPPSVSMQDEFATILYSYGAINSLDQEWPANVQIEFTEGLPVVFSPKIFLRQYCDWLLKKPANLNPTLLKAWNEELEFQRKITREESVDIFLKEVLPVYVATFLDL